MAKPIANQHVPTPRQKGLSLIELLIVVAIILFIAAIAVPHLLESKLAANESSAVGSVRTINTAEITHQVGCPSLGYASLANLNAGGGCPSGVGIIDATLAAGIKSGYKTAAPGGLAGTVKTTYTDTATPPDGRHDRPAPCSAPIRPASSLSTRPARLPARPCKSEAPQREVGPLRVR